MCLLLLAACGSESKNGDSDVCSRGSAGCGCQPDKKCDEGLVCDEGTCHGEGKLGLFISDPKARACEVLLIDKGARVLGLELSDEVRGTHVREAPKTALSFISQSDAPILGGAVQVRLADGKGDPPEVSVVHCADKDGAALEGVKVTIRG